MGSVADRIPELGTRSELMVAGCTSTLQVLDVWVNRPIKEHMKSSFDENMIEKGEKTTRKDVEHWISNAWDAIKSETIIITWRVGIK